MTNIAQQAVEKRTRKHNKHGGSGSRLYKTWQDIIKRCENTASKDFPYYGGRGITLIKPWRDDFSVFRSWAVANGYCDNLTIERRNSNGNYCPENCHWIPKSDQWRTKRNTASVIYNGQPIALRDLASLAGLHYSTLRSRLYILGWDLETAVSTPLRGFLRSDPAVENTKQIVMRGCSP